jgi:phosphoribosylformylglycinamidine synthase
MEWNGRPVVDISRAFLNSNGAEKHQNVHVLPGTVWQPQWAGDSFGEKMETLVSDLNVCSQKGLSERFDSTIGAATVLMPFGGKYQLTPDPWAWRPSSPWTGRRPPAAAWRGASTPLS